MNTFVPGKFSFYAAMLVSLFAVAGCANFDHSTPGSRKQERYSTYEALTPALKQAVDAGLIKAGMNQEAVYIVWGKPDQSLAGGSTNGETTTWVYQGTYIQDTHFWGPTRMHESYTPMLYTKAQVVFLNGLVTEWQTFPHP